MRGITRLDRQGRFLAHIMRSKNQRKFFIFSKSV